MEGEEAEAVRGGASGARGACANRLSFPRFMHRVSSFVYRVSVV